jgi:hypothetical protein
MGTSEYPAYGFIRPDHPPGHDRIAAAVPGAIEGAR